MAEFVEERVQDYIPAIEEMERIGLLTKGEIKNLIEKTKNFEYRLARRSKSKSDIVNYVNYERKLIELIKLRRQKLGVYEKKRQIEVSIFRQVVRQLRRLTRMWPSHLDTWNLRISFANMIDWKEEVLSAYTEQMRFHGNRESLWIAWAKWEVEDRQNFDGARAVLLSKASLYHPQSWILKRELFRLELLYVESLLKKLNEGSNAGLREIVSENREKVLKCAIPRFVYTDAVEQIPDPELYVQLYEVSKKFNFTKSLSHEIIRDVVSRFPNATCVWKLKAKEIVSGNGFLFIKQRKKQKDEDEVVKQNGDESEDSECPTPAADIANAKTNNELGTESDSKIEGAKITEATDSCVEICKVDQDVKEEKEDEVAEDKMVASQVSVKMTSVEKLESVCSTFDEALENVGETFVVAYIDELLSLLYQCWARKNMADRILTKILCLCETHSQLITPLHYYIWCRILCEQSRPRSEALAILERGIKTYPKALQLHCELFKQICKKSTKDIQLVKAFNRLSVDVQGSCGVQMWREVLENIKSDVKQTKLFIRGIDHHDTSIALRMRVHYLEHAFHSVGIGRARKIYKDLSWKPPLFAKVHAAMVELELSIKKVKVDRVRNVFENAAEQFGTKQPGVWLAYIHFEKKYGDPLKCGGLFTRAETQLEAVQAQLFRDLNLVIRDLQGKGDDKTDDDHGDTVLAEDEEDAEEEEEEEKLAISGTIRLFDEELWLSYSANEARKSFFSDIKKMSKALAKGNPSLPKESESDWEKVLHLVVGQKIRLAVHRVDVKSDTGAAPMENEKSSDINVFVSKLKKKDNLSDTLVSDEGEMSTHRNAHAEDDIEKILQSSATLDPEFMKKTQLAPYSIGKNMAKKIRQKEREKTKGPGWFNMKAPELTEEVKRDLELIQMRGVLDPKRHFKSRDMKGLPKYFQMGQVVDSPIDFYSSRISKKDRKRTLAEEILHDEESLRYQKRKYTEIIAVKQKHHVRHKGRGNKTGNAGKKRKVVD